MTIKDAWITRHNPDLGVLSIESQNPEPGNKRLQVASVSFSHTPSDYHPLRHVMTIGLLDREDLMKIRDAIDDYLTI